MKTILTGLLAILVIILGFQAVQVTNAAKGEKMTTNNQETRTAVFAGGCFWCVESDFEKVPGVVEVVSGYTGGQLPDPTYKEVSAGGTGHLEAVQVIYDPKIVSYEQLLDVFWKHIDPTDSGGQFVDRGDQYRSAIFYGNEEQKRLAQESRARLEKQGPIKQPVVTEILKAGKFYPAEDYHQDYYKKNPLRYNYYRHNSGRDQFLKETWGARQQTQPSPPSQTGFVKPGQKELQQKLTPLQFQVTQEEGTEPAFDNQYWNNKEEGIYVDIVSGEPLFSSRDKFDSGTGWPSYTRPLEPGNIVEKSDDRLFMTRTEVRSRQADSHLGHVFPDGPAPTGLRYCINSAALRFIPKKDLAREGYEKYLKLFE